jgi:ATP-dependent RNA helicase DDX41
VLEADKASVGLVDAQKSEAQRKAEEDAEILKAIANQKKLVSAEEIAKGTSYKEPLKTTWVEIRPVQ